MSVPAKSDPRWKSLLSGTLEPQFSVLATKLIVGRLRQKVRQDPAALTMALDELYQHFTNNSFAQRDLTLL